MQTVDRCSHPSLGRFVCSLESWPSSGFNPISALFWASVVMGLLAPPLMLIIMLAVSNSEMMGDHTNGRWLKTLGWLTTAAVTAAVLPLIWSWIS